LFCVSSGATGATAPPERSLLALCTAVGRALLYLLDQSVNRSVHLCISLSISPSLHLSICLWSLFLSIPLSSISPSLYLPVYLSVSLGYLLMHSSLPISSFSHHPPIPTLALLDRTSPPSLHPPICGISTRTSNAITFQPQKANTYYCDRQHTASMTPAHSPGNSPQNMGWRQGRGTSPRTPNKHYTSFARTRPLFIIVHF